MQSNDNFVGPGDLMVNLIPIRYIKKQAMFSLGNKKTHNWENYSPNLYKTKAQRKKSDDQCI